jgi:hypothetical protein
MGLRFQGNDEVDRHAKEERATGVLVFLVMLLAVISGAVDWFSGKSLVSYEEEIAFYIGCGLVFWFITPFYYEFRIRTKEIDGKVSAIEEGLTSAKEDRAELLERLSAIEEKLDSVGILLNGPGFSARGKEQSFFPELTGVQDGLRRLDKVEREIRDGEKLGRIREGDRQ